MLVKASDIVTVQRKAMNIVKISPSKQGALFAAIESEKVAIAFSGAEEEKKMPMNLLLGQRRWKNPLLTE